METRVRYIAVGLFAVVVGLAAIFLALWIQGGGGLRERRQVEIKFQGPAPGLHAGTDVTFNGLHVGEVIGVAFDRNDPNVVDALVSIDAATPLSATTQVSLDTQGLMGSVYVSLHGGTADKPLVAPAGARLPVLVAPTMPSVTQAAQQTLGQIQSLIGDNSKPLHELIANLQKFSGVLADNSDRIDKILAGLEQMTGGGEKPPPPPTFNLATPAVGDLLANVPQVQLVIPDPTSAVSLDTQKFVSAKPDGQLTLQTAQWSDSIPKVVQEAIQRAFEKAHYRYASLPADSLHPRLPIAAESRQISDPGRRPSGRRRRIGCATRESRRQGRRRAGRERYCVRAGTRRKPRRSSHDRPSPRRQKTSSLGTEKHSDKHRIELSIDQLLRFCPIGRVARSSQARTPGSTSGDNALRTRK